MKHLSIISIFITLFFACKSTKETSINNELNISDSAIKPIEEVVIDNASDSKKIWKNEIFKQEIKTVLLHPKGLEMAEPILDLNSNEQLVLSFDELDKAPDYYFITLIHCNSDWSSSDLLPNEYLEGFYEEEITNTEPSFNTIQSYTHYEISFPSKLMKPKYSGNYIVKVYPMGQIEQPILTQRFRIIDQKIQIEGQVKRATVIEQRNYQHEIDFNIYHNEYQINNPFNDLFVIIEQNNRSDNAVKELQPIFIKNNELIYDYEYENLFDGDNEYRFFDFKSLRYHSERIADINFTNDTNIVLLREDNYRSFQRYSILNDINGKKLIQVQEGNDPSTEADYAKVKFTLPYDHKIAQGDLYVFGQISNYEFPKTHKMIYDKDLGQYEAEIYLKQGYYNYLYVLKKNDGENIARFIEGTHYQTKNNYTIYVYHRASGELYDQLIGIKKLNSNELF